MPVMLFRNPLLNKNPFYTLGVPKGATAGTMVATYNDLASVEAILKSQDCAAVILEPVVGNSGFIKPTKEFLVGLRELTTKYGALLVFDEVMTGFRIAYGGAQQHFGVTPDVTTMGKVRCSAFMYLNMDISF
jgi:glutamate-1-semialdehyde 2,1-aminomutase